MRISWQKCWLWNHSFHRNFMMNLQKYLFCFRFSWEKWVLRYENNYFSRGAIGALFCFMFLFIFYVFSQKLLFFEYWYIFLRVYAFLYMFGVFQGLNKCAVLYLAPIIWFLLRFERSITITRSQQAGGLKEVLVANSGRCRFSVHSGFLWCFRGYGMA